MIFLSVITRRMVRDQFKKRLGIPELTPSVKKAVNAVVDSIVEEIRMGILKPEPPKVDKKSYFFTFINS